VLASDLNLVFEGTVRGISGEGLGVVESPSKKIYFVAGAWPGDRIEVQVTESTSRYGYGKLTKLIEASVDRVEAPCEHQGWGESRCGGCPWMIGSYESQLRHKEHRLKHMLERSHVLDEKTVLRPIQPSPKIFGYRNRAQLKSDGSKLGFMEVGTKSIVDVKNCHVLSAPNQQTLSALRSSLPNSTWTPQKGHTFVKLEIDDTIEASEVVVNKRQIFQQANDEQNNYMKDWLRSWLARWQADGKLGQHALELFSGSGNFTRVLLEFFAPKGRVAAAEWKGDALDKLRAQELSGLEIVESDLFRPGVWAMIRERLENKGIKIAELNFLFLDPPRDGLKFRHGLMAEFPAIDSIAYVSCDMATLARDLQYFREKGFRVAEVVPVDQFPHTSHLEVLCALERNV